MRFGVASWGFGKIEPLDRIRIFGEIGFTAISFIGRDFEKLIISAGEEIAKVLDEQDMVVITIHDNFGPHDEPFCHNDFKKRIETFAQWHRLSGRLYSITFDHRLKSSADGGFVKDMDVMLSGLRLALESTNGTEIRIGLEDLPKNENELEEMSGLDKDFDRLGVLIDLGHLNIRARQHPDFNDETAKSIIEAFFSGLPLKVWELHVHNNDGTRDAHAHLSDGNAHFEAMAEALKLINFDGVSTLEFMPPWHNIETDSALEIEGRDLDYWRKLLSFVQQ